MEKRTLKAVFREAPYPLSGHGARTIKVLKDALDAMSSDTLSDSYGNGEIIEAFQDKMARYLGKEAAIFFPSGTMAQQIALRIWCDRNGTAKVAYELFQKLTRTAPRTGVKIRWGGRPFG
ncbi:beta-eliminating lyase-related protein, partial [Sulfobacillus harzensis]